MDLEFTCKNCGQIKHIISVGEYDSDNCLDCEKYLFTEKDVNEIMKNKSIKQREQLKSYTLSSYVRLIENENKSLKEKINILNEIINKN